KQLGESGTLTCGIIGRPLPEIKWYRFGKELIQSRKYKMSSDGRNHSLSILTDEQEDEGMYTCRAINEAGEIETSGKLRLQAAPQFHPGFPLKEKYFAGAGTNVRFGVTITVHPEPQVIWLKNGERIKPGDDDRKYTFTSDKGLYQLMIHNLDLNDDAEYMVMAHNKFGEDSCSARLTVVQHPVTEETMRPMFKRLLANTECTEGESVRFELKVSGVPSPTLKWEKDGYPLQFGPKVVVIKEDVDYHVLHIRETLLEDSGVYKVTATNSAGSATCQATLKVSVHKDKPFLPAKILTKPQSVTVAEGETAKFTCDIDGEPAPTVTWLHEKSQKSESDGHVKNI
uniref:Ig-like domain-containing protein n=1 Tax=Oryzias latipes TaxID=8090 RepID=A0A3P9M5Q9_ORYLA